jgi:hypothetical protein
MDNAVEYASVTEVNVDKKLHKALNKTQKSTMRLLERVRAVRALQDRLLGSDSELTDNDRLRCLIVASTAAELSESDASAKLAPALATLKPTLVALSEITYHITRNNQRIAQRIPNSKEAKNRAKYMAQKERKMDRLRKTADDDGLSESQTIDAVGGLAQQRPQVKLCSEYAGMRGRLNPASSRYRDGTIVPGMHARRVVLTN